MIEANIVERPSALSDALFECLWGFRREVLSRFDRAIDWKQKYSLTSDPVQTFEELTQPVDFFHSLQEDGTMRPDTLAEWQERVRHIQLIPKVPEDVRRNLEWTKRLHIFSYFEYAFSTIAQHYLYLTAESAVKTRWIATLPPRLRIVRPDGSSEEIPRGSHYSLSDVMREDKNKGATLEGVPFPSPLRAIVARLKTIGVIEGWQKTVLERCAYFRNVYSHREHATISPASPGDIEEVAYLINWMFESV